MRQTVGSDLTEYTPSGSGALRDSISRNTLRASASHNMGDSRVALALFRVAKKAIQLIALSSEDDGGSRAPRSLSLTPLARSH